MEGTGILLRTRPAYRSLPRALTIESAKVIRKTNAERQAEQREREQASGLKRKLVLIPIEREPELETIVAEWMRLKKEGETP